MKNFKNSSSKLLERVCYLSRVPRTTKDLFDKEIAVRDTFPYNPDSKTAPSTAKYWAEQPMYDYRAKEWTRSAETEFVDRVNEPFSITIIDLDVRSQGGRAYKVIDDQKRCFDLREDQVIEVLKYCGIEPGGKVPGKFVWGVLGSQMRMVLAGGDLHQQMIKNSVTTKEISGNFKFGHVYRKRDKSLHLFLGKVKTPDSDKKLFAFVKLPNKPTVYLDSFYENCSERYTEQRKIALKWDQMSWEERAQWDWYDDKDLLQKQNIGTTYGHYHSPASVELFTSTKFVEELEEKAIELATKVRENSNAVHMYVNGYGQDLAEEHWKRECNDGDGRRWPSHYSTTWPSYLNKRSIDEFKTMHAQVTEQYLKARSDFRDKLKWDA